MRHFFGVFFCFFNFLKLIVQFAQTFPYFIFVILRLLLFSFFPIVFFFFGHLTPFLFSFFNTFFYLFFFDVGKIVNVYSFLFIDVWLVTYVFVIFWFFFSVFSPVVLCPYRFWRWCGNCFLDWNHVFMWSSKSLVKYWNSHTEKCFCNSKGCFSNLCSYFYLRLSNQWLFRVLLVG